LLLPRVCLSTVVIFSQDHGSCPPAVPIIPYHQAVSRIYFRGCWGTTQRGRRAKARGPKARARVVASPQRTS